MCESAANMKKRCFATFCARHNSTRVPTATRSNSRISLRDLDGRLPQPRRKVIPKHLAATSRPALIPQHADERCVPPLVWYDHPIPHRSRTHHRCRLERARSQICIADLGEVFPRRMALEKKMKQATPTLQTERMDLLSQIALHLHDDSSHRSLASSV